MIIFNSPAVWVATFCLQGSDLLSAVFSCVQTMVRLPMLRIFNMSTDADGGLYQHCERVCTER